MKKLLTVIVVLLLVGCTTNEPLGQVRQVNIENANCETKDETFVIELEHIIREVDLVYVSEGNGQYYVVVKFVAEDIFDADELLKYYEQFED